ncbi:hypothetical protein HDU80_000730 [Chytriomyces hyalinus]|nr:hypothetical protein HDU80_000730 [Chytriomyces hyalinus]
MEQPRSATPDMPIHRPLPGPRTRPIRNAATTAKQSLADQARSKRGTNSDATSAVAEMTEAEQVLMRVRANRYKRAFSNVDNNQPNSGKRRKRRGYADDDDAPTCFLCGALLPKTAAAINNHIDLCLARAESGTSSNTSKQSKPKSPQNDSPHENQQYGEELEYEEYTWAGQTRVRITSMVEGGFEASGFNVHKKADRDIDEDVLIDDDEEKVFGASQYSQEDIRKYVADGEVGENGEGGGSPVPYYSQTDNEVDVETIDVSKELAKFITEVPSDAKLIIEALTQRLKSLEGDTQKVKCLICCESYTKPVLVNDAGDEEIMGKVADGQSTKFLELIIPQLQLGISGGIG